MVDKHQFQIFASEAKELLGSLSDCILDIEKSDVCREDKVKEIGRVLHTLKGILRLVDYQKSAHLVHLLETIFQNVPLEQTGILKRVDRVTFKVIDIISEAVDLLAENDIKVKDVEIVSKLAELISEFGTEFKAPTSTPGEIEFFDDDDDDAEEGEALSIEEEVVSSTPVLDESVKVSVSKIDELIGVSSELNINKIKFVTMGEYFNELCVGASELVANSNPQGVKKKAEFMKLVNDHAIKCNQFKDQFARELRTTSSLAFELQEKVSKMRLLPAREMLSTYSRAAHDLSDELGKSVDFSIVGEDVEVDKHVVDELRSSLIHLVTNAIIHGIESEKKRQAAGKGKVGQVRFTVLKRGMMFVFICEDDGSGIDEERLIEKAISKGVLSEAPDYVTQDLIKKIIFHSGFSSVEEVGDLAGRGVGLSALHESVVRLRGNIFLEYERNHHTRFIIEIPQGLSSVSCLEVVAGKDHFLLATNYIHQTFILHNDEVDNIKNQAFFEYNGELIPVVNMTRILELSSDDKVPERFNLVVLQHNRVKIGFVVDACLGFKEIIVKPMIPYLKGLKLYEGITIQGDGSPILMLSVPTLFSDVHNRIISGITDLVRSKTITSKGKRVLLLEDTVTTRMLEKAILEHSGYSVVAVSTTREASSAIKSGEFDMFIVDIVLQGEGGDEFIRKVREDERFTDTPIIVVTSLKSDDTRLHSLNEIIQAKISKSNFDQQELLNVVDKLIEERHKAPA